MIKITKEQAKRIDKLCSSVFAMDDKWITVKPNGEEGKGSHVKIDGEGRVVAGMGGKFNGVKINEVRKDFKGPKTPIEDVVKTNRVIENNIKSAQHEVNKAIKYAEKGDKNKALRRLKGLSGTLERLSNSSVVTHNRDDVKARYLEIKKQLDDRISLLDDEKLSEKQTTTANNRLDKLISSLSKKNEKFDSMLNSHFETVKQANGQPLNDKRNGAATLKKWDRQANALNKQAAEIEKTERAIEREKDIIAKIESTNLPSAINEAIQSGEITQWRKHPNRFFVKGVEKGRMIWDEKKRQLLNSHYAEIPEDQKPIFKEAYFKLKAKLEGKSSAEVQKENDDKIRAKQEKKAAEEAKRKALQESMKSLFKKSMSENSQAIKSASENEALPGNVREGYKKASEKVDSNLSKLSGAEGSNSGAGTSAGGDDTILRQSSKGNGKVTFNMGKPIRSDVTHSYYDVSFYPSGSNRALTRTIRINNENVDGDNVFPKGLKSQLEYAASTVSSHGMEGIDSIKIGNREFARIEVTSSLAQAISQNERINRRATEEQIERGKQFKEPPPLPQWYADIRSKHSDPYWNGKYYDGKKPGEHRIYVSNKEYKITDAQKAELEQHRKDWADYKAAQQSEGTYLNVPFEQRELAKKFGAKWNPDKKQWYMPPSVEIPKALEHFSPNYVAPKPPVDSSTSTEQKRDANKEGRSFGAKTNVDIEKMSKSEAQQHLKDLYAAQKRYTNIMNEGGEGFNPYDRKIEEFSAAFTRKFEPEKQKLFDRISEERKREYEQRMKDLQEKIDKNGGWYPD